MKGTFIAVLILTAGLMTAGCQSSDTSNAATPSSVGNGQTRNNGPFAPDSNPPATTQPAQPANHY